MKELNGFLKGFFATIIMILCIFGGVFGIAKAYENTVFIAFGAKKSAIELNDDGIRILDFEINI